MDYNLQLDRFLPHQRALVKSPAQVTAMVGGYGSGKSLSAALSLVLASIYNPGCLNMGVSPNYRMARSTLQPAIFDILENFFSPGLIEGKDFTYHQTFHTFNIKAWNGKITLASAEIPSSLKGSNLAEAVLDEPGIMNFKAYQQMIARIRDPKAKRNKLTLTGTPEDLNWFYDLCEGDKKPDNFKLIRARTADNIYLPDGYIDNLLQQYDPQLVKSYLEGLFVNLAGSLAYYTFNDENIFKDEFTYDPNRPLIVSMDYNWDPNTAVIAQERIINGIPRTVVFDEYYEKCSTEIKCERIIEKYGVDQSYEIYGDATAKNRSAKGAAESDLIIVRNYFNPTPHQIRMKSGNPRRKDRLNAVNSLVCNGQRDRRLLVTPNCKHLINDFKRITMKEFENSSFDDDSLGHITDALGYYVDFRFPVKDRNAALPAVSRFTL